MLALSLLLALIPLGGIAWIIFTKGITTVDGLFMSLILLTLSGIFLLNAFLEVKASGWLSRKDAGGAKQPPATKSE